MTARQHNAAMIDRHWMGQAFGRTLSQRRLLDQRATAGGAPVGLGSGAEDSVALRTNALHRASLEDKAHLCAERVGKSCALPKTHFGVQHATPPGGVQNESTGTLEGMHSPVRLVAIDIDGTLLPTFSQSISSRNAKALKAAQEAGITVAIATGRRTAYTAPLFAEMGLRANTPLITSNGAVTRTLGGDAVDRSHMEARVARGICGLLRRFGALVFTFDRPGRGELVLEDPDEAHERITLWIEANRNAIEVVKPLENALRDGDDPVQGMVAGGLSAMKKAEKALKASVWAPSCECVRTEYPARDLAILDLLPPGVSKGWALERLAKRLEIDRKETMAIGDNWNDVDMLEWAGQSVVMGNAAVELRTMAKTHGWKQAPPNDEDGVAVVLENVLKRQTESRGRPRHWAAMTRN